MATTGSQAVANAGSNAHAVGIGMKVVEGKATRQKCIRIHVTQKMPESFLPPRDAIPKEIDGIPTDVVESPPAMIQVPPKKSTAKARRAEKRPAAKGAGVAATKACTRNKQKRQRPVTGGISASQFEVTAGTIACFCRSTKEGDDPETIYILSNNHVLANVNQAQIGDEIYQPAPLDGGGSDDTIAKLRRFVGLKLGGVEPNLVDAAIGEMTPGVEIVTSVCAIGAITGVAKATLNMNVRKHGRTSGYTEGRITDVDYDAIVGMDHQDPSIKAVFHSQLRIEAKAPFLVIGLGGDSGSLVIQKSGQKAVGLYFAGPPNGIYGIANQIGDVLNELEISLE